MHGRLSLFPNASKPINERDNGNSIDVNESQVLNTLLPIVCRDVGRDTLTKPDCRKPLSPIAVSEVGNVTDVNEPQLRNTLLPNELRDVGRDTLTKPVP